MLDALVGTAGIIAATDLAVTANGTPNMSVNVAAGAAFIQGTSATYQGIYHAFNDAPVNLAIAASDPTNPRIDIVCARIRDSVYIGGSTDDFSLVVVTGTPAGTPAAPTTPADSIVLAWVAVAHSVTTIIAGYITDHRVIATDLGGARGALPGGSLQSASIIGSIGASAVTVWANTTITVAAGRRIRITAFEPSYASTVTGDLFLIAIWEGGTQIGGGYAGGATANSGPGATAMAVVTPSAGSHTYNVTTARFSGTGTGTLTRSAAAPAFLLIEDIGS